MAKRMRKNPKRDHRGKFKKTRYLSPTQSRQFFDDMYAREERAREAAAEAYLRTPEGEAERQARNAKLFKKNPRGGMFLEYDWTSNVYRPRFGDTFTSVDGYRSFADLAEAKYVLKGRGLKLGKKTDTRTWRIENMDAKPLRSNPVRRRVRHLKRNVKRKPRRVGAFRVTHKRGKVRVRKLKTNPPAAYVIKAKHVTGAPYYFNGRGFDKSKADATRFASLSNAKREAQRIVNRLPFSILSIGVHKA